MKSTPQTAFFCAAASQQAGEDLIGTAGHYQTYVLIECPLPWAAKAFDSAVIPPALRHFAHAAKAERSVQFLCINRGAAIAPTQTTVLIYESSTASTGGFASSYRGYEFQLESLDQVVNCVESHWQGTHLGRPIADMQDILVCTHGMRDRCCARFGKPLFTAARRMFTESQLSNVRIWQASHIGGHRFAPTAIALPTGRYYGRLTAETLRAIVTRSGSVDQVRSVYRGWGLLPPPIQLLERQLWLSEGWAWLDYSIAYQSFTSTSDSDQIYAELSVQFADNTVKHYYARLAPDPHQSYYLKPSCQAEQPSTIVKYSVADCLTMSERLDLPSFAKAGAKADNYQIGLADSQT
ncbi:sucrase ferredoxin [Leptolyngbya sp. BC1307]|uniref:sucrase ferredoxin n=1 Tax=Leptolyngbya sp. BC1307 TaxID=2029589 RepID=UPI000EFCD3D9|nr:sucrase ferredoxin [Leptolyngbya sp. BC1307]